MLLRVEEPTIPGEVLADPERITIVFTNLITNAIRHTPKEGEITVRTNSLDGMVQFAVTDTGPGIAQEYLPQIFDKFFRIPGTAIGGAGLGLSISKEIVQDQGGEMGVESEVGHGSTFWFTLPCNTPRDFGHKHER